MERLLESALAENKAAQGIIGTELAKQDLGQRTRLHLESLQARLVVQHLALVSLKAVLS